MIDYNLLSQAINYYNSIGYNRIEVPWMVTEAVDSITRPENAEPYIISNKNKNLIASGEQGFLYLYLKKYLPKGKFQTVTPCFRNDLYDLTHTKQFIKNELIITDIVNNSNLDKIIDNAFSFFSIYFDKNLLTIEKDNTGYDIMCNNIELGSYGIRSCNFLEWIYGTGLAEPRTSNLIYEINKVK